MDILKLKQKAFGMDFSDTSIKLASLKPKGKHFKLVSWGETAIPSGNIVDGEIRNEEAVVSSILECLKNAKGRKLKNKNVIISLPEKKAFFATIKMPKMSKGELEKAVFFEAENYIPFKIEDVYMDFEQIDETNVILAAVPKKIADSYFSAAVKAGLRPLAFEVESQAISRALIKDGFSDSPVLIVDIGKSSSSFIIFYGQSISLTSSVPISSLMLTEAISKSLKKPIADAEKIKINLSRQKKEEARGAIDAIMPIIKNLETQIKKYISYYETHSSQSGAIKEIIISGQTANISSLAEFLGGNIGTPVKIGDPWINIMSQPIKELPPLPFKESLGYSAALGLALRGVNIYKEQEI